MTVAEKTLRTKNERHRDADRKRAARASEKLVVIPKCKNRARRNRLEKNDEAWLMFYFGPKSECEDAFTRPFTQQQQEMIAAYPAALNYGGDQSFAASRGEGKTTIAERMLLKYTLEGKLRYSVLFASTGLMAENSLDSIKTAIEENPLLLEDYPEACVPVQALENAPQRAGGQVVSGFRHDNGKPYEMAESKFSWCGQEIIFPSVPGSPSKGAIIATRGLDAAVRGLKKRGKRPQLAVIDDPDTEDTARSEEQAKKLETRIDRAIGGLGGQQRAIARLMLTTLQSRIAVSYRFTDPSQKPTWKGKRFRFLLTPPERVDLWEEYIQLAKASYEAFARTEGVDQYARGAHQMYLDNRAAMDAGASVANEYRFNPTILPDGSQVEVSALQMYFNAVARTSPEAVATEYDNDPPEEMGPMESGITATKIQLRLSGYPRGIVPPECTVLVMGMDLQKAGGHWVVKAYRPDATFYVIDYGFHESHGTTYGSEEGVEHAIRRVIIERMDFLKSNPYRRADGSPVEVALTLVDSGWQAPAVYRACMEIGLGIYPSKGHGKSHGCATMTFTQHGKRDHDTKPGDGWYLKRQPRESGGVWLAHCDTDRWKTFEHSRWLTQEGKPGAAYLFGSASDEERRYIEKRMPREAKDHHGFARHLTAEVEVEDIVRGATKRFWKTKPGRVQNHYLDASYLANVAANMQGIRLLGETKATRPPPDQRPTAAMLAGKK